MDKKPKKEKGEAENEGSGHIESPESIVPTTGFEQSANWHKWMQRTNVRKY